LRFTGVSAITYRANSQHEPVRSISWHANCCFHACSSPFRHPQATSSRAEGAADASGAIKYRDDGAIKYRASSHGRRAGGRDRNHQILCQALAPGEHRALVAPGSTGPWSRASAFFRARHPSLLRVVSQSRQTWKLGDLSRSEEAALEVEDGIIACKLRRYSPMRPAEPNYDDVIDRTERLLSLFFAGGKPVEEPPGALLSELAPLASEDTRDGPTAEGNRRAIPFLTKWLILKSHSVRYENPPEMLHWALMARLAAESCSPSAAGSRARLSDLRALAWGQLGNALRVCGRLSEARDAIGAAELHRESGTGDPELRARLLEQTASLLMAQRDFGRAAEFLEEAVWVYTLLGEPSTLSRSLISRAAAAHHSGESDRSIQMLNRAIRLLDPLEDAELFLIAQQNLAESYFEIGNHKMALFHHSANRHLQQGIGRALSVRINWQAGKVLSQRGAFSTAEAVLLQAREELSEMKLALDVGYISCDLARLYQRMGKRQRVEQTLAEGQRMALELTAEPEIHRLLRELTPSMP
jgi:tetratricopeptide (TPR) repeat protein